METLDNDRSRDIKVIFYDRIETVGKMIGDEYYIPYSAIEEAHSTTKAWDSKNNTLKLYLTTVKPLEIKNYDYKGNYLHYDKNRVETWNVEFDPNGIPKTKYPFGTFYNPSTISLYGLEHYSLYLLNNDIKSKEKFLKVANWLINNQDARGGWAYKFDLHFYPSRFKEKLNSPWYSAIGLGMALSVLARAYNLTKDYTFIKNALKSTKIFETPSNKNGVLSKFENKFYFYEECPTDPPSYILNGFMFALIGLYDLYQSSKNNEALKLYNLGIVSLKRMLPLYDLGHRTAYDLTHYTTDGGYPNVAKWGYHITHIHLLEAINSIEKDKKLNETLERWKGYLQGIIN